MQVLKTMTKQEEKDFGPATPARPAPLLRKDLVDRFCARRDDVTKKEAMWWFRAYEEEIESALLEGKELRLVNFCAFRRKSHTKRRARNIQTGELFVTSSAPRIVLVWSKRIRTAFRSNTDA
jgi:nucleoid DNA-binding protein